MTDAITQVLLLLLAAVISVGYLHRLGMPPILGYLILGVVLGPHALGLMSDSPAAHYAAEVGIVFLMFSIGLEFSLPKLYAMRRLVFGLGLAQVVLTLAGATLIALMVGLDWRAAVTIGAVLSMSSTAVLSKLLAERTELDAPHGRTVMGVLLFQDLAVVPMLVLIPSMGLSAERLALELLTAGLKAAVALIIILYLGPKLMQRWFFLVARRRSAEVFMLNVLLVVLGLSWVTEQAGLSLALGAFLAGMLLSETDYRYRVEEDIKPFRDVLMGLFFVTVGMLLDLRLVVAELPAVLGTLILLLIGKFLLIAGLCRAFGEAGGTAIRTGVWLAAGGEFGFVLLSLAGKAELLPPAIMQVVLTALILSLLMAPILAQYADQIALRLLPSEWLMRSMQLTSIAAESMDIDRHAILCGFGRNGQYLGRLLEQEGIRYIALDLDPDRVREAAAAGETVVYGDAAKREALIAAGIHRAAVVVVTYADTASALRVLHQVHELRPEAPVIVRLRDERDLDRILQAGAAEAVPEAIESSMMLASHALLLAGLPLSRVVRRIQQVRGMRYHLLRGIYQGAEQLLEEALGQHPHKRLHSVPLDEHAQAVDRILAAFDLTAIDVEVTAVRRGKIRIMAPAADFRLQAGDVVVLLVEPAELAVAETRLLRGL